MNLPITKPTSYKTQSYDTAIASELVLFALWRTWNSVQRATHLNHNSCNARATAWYIAKTTLANQNKTQQIRYFLSILKLQQSNLDFTYLQQWADILELSTELEQAFLDSSTPHSK